MTGVGPTAPATAPPRPRPWGRVAPLGAWMTAVSVVGLPLAVWLCVRALGVPSPLPDRALVVLVLALVVGELLPIEIARNGRRSDEITISTTFALALVLVAPLGLAVLAQAVPLVLDDVRRGKDWTRPVFNIAQYTLTFTATRAAYCAVSGQGFFHPEAFGRDDLVAAFVAGGVFFVVNHGLVGTAVALWGKEPVVAHLLDDIRFQLSTAGLLVCLAPLVLVATEFSLWLVPVLLLPMAAVRKSAQLAAQREHDALHDGLTGLPNRALLHLELGRALADAQRSGRGVALALIDLDHFKEINDTLGHHVGDLLIVEVGSRLAQAASGDVVVARLGGDEFAVLHTPAGDASRCRESATALVDVLRAGLAEPLTLAGVRLDVQASTGIALYPEHGTTVDDLIARADVAMYAAKEERGGWAMYDPETDQHSPDRLALLAELRDGLGRGELVLQYQPKCRARTGEVLGVEALVRWQHPRRGLLLPDDFLPIAENTGLISDLTLEVLDLALRQQRRWLDDGRELTVAVNLSVRHLTDLTLPGSVEAALRRHGVPAAMLTLEVTETSIMNDPSRAVTVLRLLRDIGVRVAVDDYGTGYSSLAYLKRLSVDELKIDKSFTAGMRTDDNDSVIVRSTIELGHNLGLQLVAEGVEDDETWQLLLPLGCDVLQGYGISPPLTAERLELWLAAHEPYPTSRPDLRARPRVALPHGGTDERSGSC